MPDTVTNKVVFSGNNRRVIQITNISDGTGETNVVKIDRSALVGPDKVNPPSKLRIDSLQFSIQGFEGVKLSWDDTLTGPADETAVVLSGQGFYEFRDVGGLNPTLAATTLSGTVGDLLLSIVGTPAANDTYDITINVRLES